MSNEPLSDAELERLEELDRLVSADRPAPWHWAQIGPIDWGYVTAANETTVLFGERCEGAVDEDDVQAQLLVALRNAAPRLLATARRAKKMEEALIQARGALRLDHMVQDDGMPYGTTVVALEAIDAALSTTQPTTLEVTR